MGGQEESRNARMGSETKGLAATRPYGMHGLPQITREFYKPKFQEYFQGQIPKPGGNGAGQMELLWPLYAPGEGFQGKGGKVAPLNVRREGLGEA